MPNNKKKVFITGGTGSVGISLIKSFSDAGFIVYFQFVKNAKKANEIEKAYKAKPLKIDFRTKFELPEIKFDIVINNAGINISGVLTHEVGDSTWLEMLKVNLTTPFQICKFYLPAMIKKRWGRIININSIYGLRGSDYNSPYNASKHGLAGLTKSIAKEYAIYGITCNEICPGAIKSGLMNRIARDVAKEEGIAPKDYLTEVASTYPTKRLVLPLEVSNLAVFLASEEASGINGSSIPVDGGLIC